MRRRDFIGVVAGATAWPLAAHAQHGERVRRIGVLMTLSAGDPEVEARKPVFEQSLRHLGWTGGATLSIEYRSTGGDPGSIRRHAAELVALAPDVIVTVGSLAPTPVLQATRTIPVVMVNVPDPVGAGWVQSLARPGGNATGFINFEYGLSGKWIELLKQIAPSIERVAVLRSATTVAGIGQFAAVQSGAHSLGVELTPVGVRDDDEIERGVTAFARLGNGGLISYGPDALDGFRRAAGYVDRILRGEKPADLPVQAPTKYNLVVNLKTARGLGLEVPPTLLATADEVIE
jgi:putative ABC transport system substrate-binding protein